MEYILFFAGTGVAMVLVVAMEFLERRRFSDEKGKK